MKKYILALDQGTTSSRAVLFASNAAVVGIEQKETAQLYPQAGWVEQNAVDIWNNQLEVARNVLKHNNISASQIAAIGITNQRETTVVWDKNTGQPVYNAIIWQDKRTIARCEQLRGQGWSDVVRSKTGLVIDSYFSATKLQWILEHVEGAKAKADNGQLLFGTIDTWLMWKLSGGKLHITDVSNASRTMLFNIDKLCWDEELLQLFEIPASMLPRVVDSSAIYGNTDQGVFDGANIPLAAMAGDEGLAEHLGAAIGNLKVGCEQHETEVGLRAHHTIGKKLGVRLGLDLPDDLCQVIAPFATLGRLQIRPGLLLHPVKEMHDMKSLGWQDRGKAGGGFAHDVNLIMRQILATFFTWVQSTCALAPERGAFSLVIFRDVSRIV